MKKSFRTFLLGENGQGTTEYGMVLAVLAIVAAGAGVYLAPKIKSLFDTVGSNIDAGNGVTY
jgi:Flp pilus assembly pilin Flp